MKTILIIVDVQNGFVTEALQPIVDGIEQLLAARAFDAVFFTRFINDPDSLFVKQLDWAEMQSGAETQIVPELLPYVSSNVFDKSTYSALTPALLTALEAHQPDRVYVAGLETDACVMQTAMGLFDAGCPVRIIEDLVGTAAGDEIHQGALTILRRNIGEAAMVSSVSL